MQNIVKNGKRSGTVCAISSKSHVHRLLICAALSDKKTEIEKVSFSKDIYATIHCLNGYLADISVIGDTIIVEPYENAKSKTLDLKESGSTYRFLVPVACAIGKEVSFIGAQRLKERPLSPLYELLVGHGSLLSENGVFPLKCAQKMKSGEFKISGEISSQFISGLIFALPLLKGDSVICVTGKMESYPYIKMTLDLVRSFGIEVKEENQKFYIKGNQKYVSPQKIRAEGDWSNAAFFASIGALSPKGVKITNVNMNSLQGDIEILNILKDMGANVFVEKDSVFIMGGNLNGTKIDASNIPDLVPVLATVACGAIGETVIYNAQRLRLKESDRIESVYQMLKNLGADLDKTDDGFLIRGTGTLFGGVVDSFNDHRIVMSASVASSVTKDKVIINNSEAVQKSYPAFFNDLDSLCLEELL